MWCKKDDVKVLGYFDFDNKKKIGVDEWKWIVIEVYIEK